MGVVTMTYNTYRDEFDDDEDANEDMNNFDDADCVCGICLLNEKMIKVSSTHEDLPFEVTELIDELYERMNMGLNAIDCLIHERNAYLDVILDPESTRQQKAGAERRYEESVALVLTNANGMLRSRRKE